MVERRGSLGVVARDEAKAVLGPGKVVGAQQVVVRVFAVHPHLKVAVPDLRVFRKHELGRGLPQKGRGEGGHRYEE